MGPKGIGTEGSGTRQSHWTELVERAEQVLSSATETSNRIGSLRDQVLGSTPMDENKPAEAVPNPDNFKDQMRMILNSIDERLQSISRNIDDLQ